MNASKRLLAVLVIFMSLISTGFTQTISGQTSIGIYGGLLKCIGGDRDASTINPYGGIQGGYAFSDRFTAQLSLGLGWVRPRAADSHFTVGSGPYRTYLYPLHLDAVYHLMTGGLFLPYLSAGIGVMQWNLRDITTEDKWFPLPESGTSIHGTQTNFTAAAGGGLKIKLTELLFMDLGFRYTYLIGQNKDMSGTGDANNGLLEFKLGLAFVFGGSRDTDGDGIDDKFDNSPYDAEDFDGFQDEDGTPDPDNDNDGVLDAQDQAPDLPEDIDGFQDEDGIPDLDNDGDGIPDAKDGAPNEKEDVDGFEDQDGVPDLDNDKDGIPDGEDACPNRPETKNGFEDEDGCPDERPDGAEVVTLQALETSEPLVLPSITFESGTSTLQDRARATLDQLLSPLTSDKTIRLEIRGFTDSVGSAASNLNLSQKRADAVKAYLVRNGIGFNRLIAIGYGEANPIASNAEADGRAKNRRIELLKIED